MQKQSLTCLQLDWTVIRCWVRIKFMAAIDWKLFFAGNDAKKIWTWLRNRLRWVSAGLLLKVQKFGITLQSPCHIATQPDSLNTTGQFVSNTVHMTQAPYHSLDLLVCSICPAKKDWQQRALAGDTLVFSFWFSLNWTVLLCLASCSLLSSTGAWLLTQRDEAKGNELDRPGRQNTAHALPSSLLGKRQQRPPDHFSQYPHSSSELLPCPFMCTGTNWLWAFSPPQQLALEYWSKHISLFLDEPVWCPIHNQIFAWISHEDFYIYCT